MAEAVAVAVHLQDMDVVGEPVQQRAGEAFRTEHLGPLIEGQVGGDQDGAALVALAEDLEEEFADDQQDEAGHLPLEVQQPSLVPGPQRSALPRFHRRDSPARLPQPVYFANMARLDRRPSRINRWTGSGWVRDGCVNAVSDARAAAVVQLASTTYAGANQIHPADLLRDRGIDLSLRSDNNHPDRRPFDRKAPPEDNRRNFTIDDP